MSLVHCTMVSVDTFEHGDRIHEIRRQSGRATCRLTPAGGQAVTVWSSKPADHE
jgi:hypothetical protein